VPAESVKVKEVLFTAAEALGAAWDRYAPEARVAAMRPVTARRER
jgi:hypothetical protein